MIFAIILLIFLYLSSTGQYINLLNTTSNIVFLYGFIDFAISTLIMTAFPLIIRIKSKKRIKYRKCVKICVLNSIILFILSMILTLLINFGFVGGVGAIFYCFINMWLFASLDE